MKVITWNVNGIRTRIFNKKSCTQSSKMNSINPEDGSPMFNLLSKDPDFVCLQETRCSVKNGSKFEINGYESVFNESKNVGAREANRYSGTCIFYKNIYKPISVEYQVPGYNDNEGRIIILHFDTFSIINVYTPNSGTNFENRLEWQSAFLNYLESLDRRVIYCGDMNVAWRDEDVHFKVQGSPTYKSKVGEDIVGFLKEEREFVPKLLALDFIDAYVNNEKNKLCFDGFTYWDARSKKIEGLPGARYNRIGWRIDYHFVKNFKVAECYAMPNIGTEYIALGESQCSDHCPVFGLFDLY